MNDERVTLRAKRFLERVDRQSTFVAGEYATISRWLTASLFALNGGGAAAFLNSSDSFTSRIWPIGFFAAGVLLAMLGAVVLQELYGSLADLLSRQDQYWSRVSLTGRRLRWVEARFRSSRRRRYRLAWAAPLCGWISAIFFVAGVLAAALR